MDPTAMNLASTIRSGDSKATTAAARTDHSPTDLQHLYAPIEGPLRQVELRLSSELESPYEALLPLLRHGTQLGGKRLRPAILLLAGQAVGSVSPEHMVLGTVIEMVHTATLVHDDVLDAAETRRHVPTVNARWNEHTSILLGDYLFSQSFRLAATLPSTEACRWIGEAARLVCEGELRQILDRNTIDLDESTYFDIIRGKTAELCRVACQLGGRYAGSSGDQLRALGNYGESLGIAFQIADDYLDLWGEDGAVGKTLGTDIEQGKMTLPVIRLLETADRLQRPRIIRILRGPAAERLPAIRPLLEASDAAQYTRRTALRFCDHAVRSLDLLPDSHAKDCLQAIAEFSVSRRF
jgi:octaprenyl-diphosphate synthase